MPQLCASLSSFSEDTIIVFPLAPLAQCAASRASLLSALPQRGTLACGRAPQANCTPTCHICPLPAGAPVLQHLLGCRWSARALAASPCSRAPTWFVVIISLTSGPVEADHFVCEQHAQGRLLLMPKLGYIHPAAGRTTSPALAGAAVPPVSFVRLLLQARSIIMHTVDRGISTLIESGARPLCGRVLVVLVRVSVCTCGAIGGGWTPGSGMPGNVLLHECVPHQVQDREEMLLIFLQCTRVQQLLYRRKSW